MQGKFVKFAILAALVASFTGCITPEPPQEGKLFIRALIDGKDFLYIKGDSMWIVHDSFQLPGKWAGEDLPVYINKDQQWPIVWNGTLSDVVKILKPESALPTYGTWSADNMKIKFYTAGYGTYNVKQYPLKENNYTMILTLDDAEPLGAHWFCLDIDWDETAK